MYQFHHILGVYLNQPLQICLLEQVVTPPTLDVKDRLGKFITSFSCTITEPTAEVVNKVPSVTLAFADCVVVPKPEVITNVVGVILALPD